MKHDTQNEYDELDTSADEAISYHRAQQIVQKKIPGATDEEFCMWVFLGYLHVYKWVDTEERDEKSRWVSKLLAMPDPFSNIDPRSKPMDLLISYKFSKNEIEHFDPKKLEPNWNPGGRFLTHSEAVQHLGRDAGEEYAKKLIEREVSSGEMEALHPVLGVLTPGADDHDLELKYGMFALSWIEQLWVEEFGVEDPVRPREKNGTLIHKADTSEQPPAPVTVGSPPVSNPFQDMPGLQWNEIVIKFVSADAVEIRARHVKYQYTYAEMGFKNRKARDASPDSIWRTLRDVLARFRGEVSWHTEKVSEGDRNRMKRTVSTLRKRLCAFFGIEDDPFHPYRNEKSYKTKFVLLPAETSFDSADDGGDDDLESIMPESPDY